MTLTMDRRADTIRLEQKERLSNKILANLLKGKDAKLWV